MNDRDALFAAVCANPEDDTTRLAFADWLDEHGEAKRAAFLRATVEYARLRSADTEAAWMYRLLNGDHPTEAKRIKWGRVSASLAAIFEAEKATRRPRIQLTEKSEKLPKLKEVTFSEEARGFMRCIHVEDGDSFLKHAEAIFRAAPITDAIFAELDETSARLVADRGYLARLRSICLNDADPKALHVLGTHPDAAGVRNLEIECGEASTHDLGNALLRGTHWTGLHKLTLEDFDGVAELGRELESKLFRKPVFSGLRELTAWGNNFTDAFARAIAAGGLRELRFADIAINSITDVGFMAIARSKGLPNLRYLDIASNDAEDGASTAAVLNSTQLPQLTVLKLGGSMLPIPAASELAKPGRGPTLRSLEMPGQNVSTEQIAALAACPAVHGLWLLEMDYAGVRNPALNALLKSPGFDQLTFLDLEGNKLTLRGAQAIANWPKAATLQTLRLSGNSLSGDGLAALAASPYLSNLQYITVSGTATSAGFKKLKKRFGKKLQRRT